MIRIIKFYLIINLMNSNSDNIVTGNSGYYSFSNPTANIGLPINSRFINQSQFQNQSYLNNYHLINQSQPQQLYSPLSTVPRQSIVYQNNISPLPIQKVSNSQVINSQQQSMFGRQGSQAVRTRLVPVTQYVPVYELEDVQTVTNQTNTIHQRVILHQPEAFKQRIQYDQKMEVMPTVMEEQKIYAAPLSSTSVKVVKVQRDPLVETVQGEWKSRISNSRNSYVAPTPLPRESKPCCSGWLFFLLALLALAGILAAILLGKAFSQQKIDASSESTVSGTKVQGALPPNQTVKALSNAKISGVEGTTAVTTPVQIKPTVIKDTQPIKPEIQSIAPTDISVVANTAVTQPSQLIQPEQISFGPVKPVVINPLNRQQPYQLSFTPTYPTTQPSLIQQSSVPPAPLTSNTVSNGALNASTNEATKQSSLIFVHPQTVQPITIKPQSVAPTTIEPITYVSSLGKNQSTLTNVDSGKVPLSAYQVPAVVIPR